MRGDRPYEASQKQEKKQFTPHARGSTVSSPSTSRETTVYPACAGIDLFCRWLTDCQPRLPRMRGDRPTQGLEKTWLEGFTPHARGSTVSTSNSMAKWCVYPACAGIDLGSGSSGSSLTSLPRMRGDRPSVFLVRCAHEMFTPHARGSTADGTYPTAGREVYPACAGIDPGGG